MTSCAAIRGAPMPNRIRLRRHHPILIRLYMMTMVQAFNKWLDDSINKPDEFYLAQEIVAQHLAERVNGIEPTYGDMCAATIERYMQQEV